MNIEKKNDKDMIGIPMNNLSKYCPAKNINPKEIIKNIDGQEGEKSVVLRSYSFIVLSL